MPTFILTLLVAAFGCLTISPSQAKPNVEAWAKGASVASLNTFGLTGTLPDTKGKVVFLDFWASWCGPCKKSFPILEKWQSTYAKQGLVVLGVSVDEKQADMEAFLKKQGVAFANVHDTAQKLVAAANVSSMPTSFLIDRKGVIRQVHTGFNAKDEAVLCQEIVALLAAK
jgi:thiol-disulfide isomerase/thioredoxin